MAGGSAQFYTRLVDFIRQHHMLERGEQVVVAVSGGVDSIVLLTALAHLQDSLGIGLHVAHLNHQFRGAEAARDADFVRQAADRLQLPCTIASRDVPRLIEQKKLSPQDAARQVRYQFLEELADQLQAQKIATAHNADDQAETVLLGIIRGVGLHGLGGIQPVNKIVIRPLLSTTRDQIEAFAREQGMDFVFDSSNASRKYVRNAIRHDLLPLLKQQFSPAIVKRLTTYAQFFQEDAFFIDKIARERYIQICQYAEGAVRFDLKGFAAQEKTIQRALIYQAFEALTGNRHRLETPHVRAIMDLFTRSSAGKHLTLPGRTLAIRSYEWGHLTFQEEERATAGPSPQYLKVPGKTQFGQYWVETRVSSVESPAGASGTSQSETTGTLTQDFDYSALLFPVRIRVRAAGDFFQPLGMGGKKRLKKFFIDRKVPRNKRDNIPLLEDRQGIIWVVGHEIDDRVKITTSTKKIVTCRLTKATDNNGGFPLSQEGHV